MWISHRSPSLEAIKPQGYSTDVQTSRGGDNFGNMDEVQSNFTDMPSHVMPIKILLDCIYLVIKPENKSIDEHIFNGENLNQPYKFIAALLGNMVETNKGSQNKYDKLVAQVYVLSKWVMELEEEANERKNDFSLEEKQGKKNGGLQSDNFFVNIQ